MKKLTMKEIYEIIDMEDRCGVQNLIQEIFASEFAEKGIDIIEDDKGDFTIVKGTTFKIKTTKANK